MSAVIKESYRLLAVQRALGRRYTIIKKIATGGFGSVYLGEHSHLGRKVAIKVLLRSLAMQDDVVKRFERESRAAASLTHPNIIDIYDVGQGESEQEEAGIYYFVMKYIEGETLAQKMQREERIAPAEGVHIVRQLADALAYAHENAVIHRDIKPANVMLDEYGKPILMDFGVAHLQFDGDLTQKGTMMGTPHYLAPEQPLGKPIDGRSDIYSLGIMFYEMLSGRPAFHDKSPVTLIFKHINEPPMPLNHVVRDLHPELCRVVHKMIEKDPDDRYQSAADITVDLQNVLQFYPPPNLSLSRVRNSTGSADPGTTLLQADEHLQNGRFVEAIDMCLMLSQRTLEEGPVKKRFDDFVLKLLDIIPDLISRKEFLKARYLLRQAELLSCEEERLENLRAELDRHEIQHLKNSELKDCYDTVQMALEQKDSTEAIEYLTRALVIDPPSAKSHPFYTRTEKLILAQIDQLCERLDFLAAKQLLELAKETFSESFETKAEILDRNRRLYERFLRARELFKNDMLQEAVREYRDLLETPAIHDFQYFSKLQREAEDTLKMAREQLLKIEVDASEKQPSSQPEILASTEAAPALKNPSRVVYLRWVVATAVIFLPGFLIFLHYWSTPSIAPVARWVKMESTELPLPTLPSPAQGSIDTTNAQVRPAAPQIVTAGTMIIQSRPPGANILIGKKRSGLTPRTFHGIPVGTYTLTLTKPGYKKYSRSIQVRSEQTAILTADLLATTADLKTKSSPSVKQEVVTGMLVPLTGEVTPPKLIKRVAVRYPEEAKSKGITGTVRLELFVSETGRVSAVRVVQSVDPLLASAAVKCVKQWIYEPATKAGVRVSVWLPISMSFVK